MCVRGRVHGSCRDDDIDYAILGLHLLETYGFGFSTEQVGDLWLLRLPYLQTFTAERATYRNLANGLKPPLTATYDNPYQYAVGVKHVFVKAWHSTRVGILLYVLFAQIVFWALVSGVLHRARLYWKL